MTQIGNLLADPRQIDRAVAHTLVQQDDLARCPYRVAIEAHAAVALRRRIIRSRLDGPAKASATLR